MIKQADKQRVYDIVKSGLSKAEAYYNRKFEMPAITYTIGGRRVAGLAWGSKNLIELNPVLMSNNLEQFIERTPLHELAHLIDYHVNPDNHKRGITVSDYGRVKRAKRDVHGADWQHVARVCGLDNPTRCHQYDTSDITKGSGVWMCTCGCEKRATVGPKIHQQLLANPSARRFHRGWPLKQVVTGNQPAQPIKEPAIAQVVAATVVVSGQSKLDQCWSIYKQNVGQSRADVIKQMVERAGCTPAGASTYYSTCKKRYAEA